MEVIANEIDDIALMHIKDKFSKDANVLIEARNVVDVLLKKKTLKEIFGAYNKVLANPPYGAWLSEETRRLLKSAHPELYAKETYGLFVYACVRSLADYGTAVFILPDTFLWLNRHKMLREFLFEVNSVSEIALFPSKYFPNIAFGYSGMCIITVENSRKPRSTVVHYAFKNKLALADLANSKRSEFCTSAEVDLNGSMVSRKLAAVVHKSEVSFSGGVVCQNLGDIADVKTGFYSGNDKRWLRKRSELVRRSNGFLPIKASKINGNPATWKLTGLPEYAPSYIPILKGGAAVLHKQIDWYVNWSESAIASYRRKGKDNPARFQNAQFYFRKGVGVPMVSSASLTAFLIDGVLFDQGVVGIFPDNPEDTYYLLGYLNTTFASDELKKINPTANNSANYMKRLGIPKTNDQECILHIVNSVETLLCDIRDGRIDSDRCRKELDRIYAPLFGV